MAIQSDVRLIGIMHGAAHALERQVGHYGIVDVHAKLEGCDAGDVAHERLERRRCTWGLGNEACAPVGI